MLEIFLSGLKSAKVPYNQYIYCNFSRVCSQVNKMASKTVEKSISSRARKRVKGPMNFYLNWNSCRGFTICVEAFLPEMRMFSSLYCTLYLQSVQRKIHKIAKTFLATRTTMRYVLHNISGKNTLF